jgi:hypothetical protein
MRMRYLVAALGVHVALALALSAKRPPALVAAPAPSSEVEIDYAVEESAPTPPGVAEAIPTPRATPATSTRTAVGSTTSSKASATAGAEVVTAEPAAASSGAWAAPIFVAGAAATMDTHVPGSFFLPSNPGAPPPDQAQPPPVSTTGGLAEGLAAHDASLGLDSGGPVVSAAHAVPVVALVAIDGAGVFEVVTDASGHVVSVRVVDATSDDLEWGKVARALQAQLAQKTLRVPRGAHGVAVRMRVEVVARMPSGAVSGHALRPYAGSTTEAYAGVAGDLSDIGAHPVRTVHARVVTSRPL